MAFDEKILINIESNIAQRQQEVDRLRVAIEKLRLEQAQEIKQAKESKASSEELAKLKIEHKKSIEQLNTQLKSNNKELQLLNRVQQSEAKTIENLRAKLAVVSKAWAENYKVLGENSDETKALAEEKLKLTEQLKKEESATGDNTRNVGNYKESIKAALNETGLFSRELGYLTKAQNIAKAATVGTSGAMKILRIALISTGIGALVVAFGSLVAYFSSTEEGVLKLQKVFAPFRVLLGNITDILSSFGEGLVELFSGNFKRAQESFNMAWEKTKNIVSETTEETRKYNAMLDAQLALTKAEREATVRLADLETKVSESRLIAKQKDLYTNEERLKAMDAAIAGEKEMLAINESLATERLRLIEIEQEFSNTTGEELDKRAELEAELIRTQKTTLDRMRELSEARGTIIREIEAEGKAQAKLWTDLAVDLEKQLEAELKLLEQQEDARVQKTLDSNKAILDANKQLNEQIFAMSQALEDNELIKIENERQRRIAEVEASIADEQLKADAIVLINQQAADAINEIEKASREQQLSAISGMLGQAAGLFKEHTVAFKVVASAEALINTFLSAQKAYTSLAAFPPLAVAAAAAATAAGLANVAKINEVKFAKGGILSGASHERGGIKLFGAGGYYGEAEGGEIILTKNVSKNPSLLRAASNINEMAGGRGFYATGGILPQQSMVDSVMRRTEKVYVPALVVQDVTELQQNMMKVEAMAVD